MTDKLSIYQQFDKAFPGIQAYAIISAEYDIKIGKAVFKRSRTNGTVACWLHIHGCPMVKGKATGGGYDKTSAAFAHATTKLRPDTDGNAFNHRQHIAAFQQAATNESAHWDDALRNVGYHALSVI